MIGSSGVPAASSGFRGLGPAGEPAPRGHLGLSSAQSRPFRPRFAGGVRGISFRSRRAKHQENPRAKDRVQAPQKGQHRCPNEGKVPEISALHKRLWKYFRQKLQAGDSECNKSSFLVPGTKVSADGSTILTCCLMAAATPLFHNGSMAAEPGSHSPFRADGLRNAT